MAQSKTLWLLLSVVLIVMLGSIYMLPKSQITITDLSTSIDATANYYRLPERDILVKDLIVLGHNEILCRLTSDALASTSPHPMANLSRLLANETPAGTLFSKCGEIEPGAPPLEPHPYSNPNDTRCLIVHDDTFAYQASGSRLGLAEYLERVDELCQNLPKIVLDVTNSLRPDELTPLSSYFRSTLLSQLAQFETHSRTNSAEPRLPNDFSLDASDAAILESIQEKPYTFWKRIPSELACLDRRLLKNMFFSEGVRILDYDRRLCPSTHAKMKSGKRKSQEKRKFYFIFTTSKESKIPLMDRLNLGIKTISGEWKPRTSRSIESVFFNYPNADVQVYSNTLDSNHFAAFTRLGYKIRVMRYDLDSLFKGSPLEKWAKDSVENRWDESAHFYSHMSDALRLFLVWKHGGTYLDTDMIMTQTLDKLDNTVGKTGAFRINGAILNFQAGSKFLYDAMVDCAANYDPNVWAANGPDLLTRNFIAGSYLADEVRLMEPWIYYPLESEKYGRETKRACFYGPIDDVPSLPDFFEEHAHETEIDNVPRADRDFYRLSVKSAYEAMLQARTVHMNTKITSGAISVEGSLCYRLLNEFAIFWDVAVR
eukprot:TRINITY_DN518_c0_g1_i1.p1 TRINITY_DN518_c0_g1~~TRINITY_DN518_c0_g1_i1.p1  ORF type:complete len:615 (+),score=132.01 TRINITY_DN518_c0_g1_i1:49-1845(+)